MSGLESEDVGVVASDPGRCVPSKKNGHNVVAVGRYLERVSQCACILSRAGSNRPGRRCTCRGPAGALAGQLSPGLRLVFVDGRQYIRELATG